MFYCIDQPCTHLFLLGWLKLNLFLLLDQLTNADVGDDRERSFEIFFWEGDLTWWDRGGQFLERGSGFLEIVIMNYTVQLLFVLLFTCRLKDTVSL